MEECQTIVSVDIDYLTRTYFWQDKPVIYSLGKDKKIEIYPILVKDSEIFISSIGALTIDKNSSSDPSIISMPYLQFLLTIASQQNPSVIIQLNNILRLCLKWETAKILFDESGKISLYEEKENAVIKAKHFDDIRRIILYQNLLNYDDSYVNPEIKKTIEEYERTVNKGVEIPSLERKISIITSHCGLTKENQMEMTYRAFTSLFEEVCGEIEFSTTRAVAILMNALSNNKNELDHWIFKKKKDKYEKYFVAEDKYNRSMGGDGKVRSITSEDGISDILLHKFQNSK